VNMLDELTEAETASLARWHIGNQTVTDWLAASPDPDRVRAMLVRTLDRGGRDSVISRALAVHLGADVDLVYAENFPRKAAKLAAEYRARGDDPHADRLHAALVAMMFCANCGRPLADPVSIERGIGPDCWPRIDPGWRAAISARLSGQAGPFTQGSLL
jgi:hypothetical protein